MSFDRLDFEDKLMDCWHVTSDLKTLTEGVLESDMTKDQIANVLLGLEHLYNLKFDVLFRQFKQMLADQRSHTNE